MQLDSIAIVLLDNGYSLVANIGAGHVYWTHCILIIVLAIIIIINYQIE